ncbi:unnamed protein product, partial [Ectocarpus sp. 8 AP-2014]
GDGVTFGPRRTTAYRHGYSNGQVRDMGGNSGLAVDGFIGGASRAGDQHGDLS